MVFGGNGKMDFLLMEELSEKRLPKPHPAYLFCATDVLQAFRPNEDVDISGDRNQYHLAWIRAGEFLRYTVNVEKAGEPKSFVIPAFLLACGVLQKRQARYLVADKV